MAGAPKILVFAGSARTGIARRLVDVTARRA